MPNNNVYKIAYGDGFLEAKLPERTRIIKAPPPLPPLPNLEQAVREALESPIAHEPLSKLVNSKSKVTIAFDDPSGSNAPIKKPDVREVVIKVLLQELDKLGVSHHNIQLICANALHRKWTRRELATILGDDITLSFAPGKLYCHDAEDRENLVYLGDTERGFEVEVNRAVVDSDQLIYVNNTRTPFNGGWKSIVVGLSSYRSIRQHHRPFPRASGKSVFDPKRSSFQKLLWEMGDVIAKELAKKGRRIFTIETALNNAQPMEVTAVFAGHPPEVHVETLKWVEKQQVVEVQGQSDVAIYGIHNQMEGYSALSTINPILVRNQGLAYSFFMFQNKPLVRQGGIVILVHPCEPTFNEIHFPSYIELFEKILPKIQDPFEIWDLYAEDFAHRPEYIYKYRYGYAYHGVHPLILWGQAAYPLRQVSKVFLAGAKDFETARLMGFEPFATVEEAIAEAERILGKDCSISYPVMPPTVICDVQ